MKTKIIQNIKYMLIGLLLAMLHRQQVQAQGEWNNWIAGEGIGFDFGSGTPQYFGNNVFPMFGASSAMSDASGQLLFYTNGFWAWNRNHHIMPELTNGISGYAYPTAQTVGYPPLMPYSGGHAQQATCIAKVPRSNHLYYVFSLAKNGVLYYSMVDMNLNNGLGGIVNGRKGIYLHHGLTEKLNVVAGCDNIWLLTRAMQSNEYHAFEIRDTGIVMNPVVSNVGELPVSWYRLGSIRFSADGAKMAAACHTAGYPASGLELYDFDKLNGIVSNAQVLDSNSVTRKYYGVCFSEDGSKLYASEASFSQSGSIFSPGKVRQFNLSLNNMAAIAASNTVLYTDAIVDLNCVSDLQRAANGKIYFNSVCNNGPFHVINNPNLAGAAANVQVSQIGFNSGSPRQAMPNNIAIAPIPDTNINRIDTVACFVDSIVLTADSGRHYHWNNGSTNRTLTIHQSGQYTVQFMNRFCQWQIDTFDVRFYALPLLNIYGFSCPGGEQGKAKLLTSDSFGYQWYRSTSGGWELIFEENGNNGSELMGLDTGAYKVRIMTSTGCDSTLTFTINALPVPEAKILGDTIACTKTEIHFEYDGDAPQLDWLFSNSALAQTKSVSTIFYDTGYANVRLIVSNAEGCSDTLIQPIQVKGLDLRLKASDTLVSKGSKVRLDAWATKQFEVLQWQPSLIFGNNTAKWQSLQMDSSTTFYVTAISEEGCMATASVLVEVLTALQMPNAFSPNADGKNDRFAPMFRGDALIRKFEVYNRWGQVVYSAWGNAATLGWDGNYNGKACDMGTYFYYINVEIQKGKTIEQKGDVTLIR